MKKACFIILFISLAFLMNAQHPYFASLNQQLLVTNPSFAGSNKQLRVQSNFGGNAPDYFAQGYSNGYYLGADILIKKHHGIGISYERNGFSYGLLLQNQASLSYAYHITINGKLKIVPSIQASYFNLILERTKLDYGGNYGNEYNYLNINNWWTCYPCPDPLFKQNADFSAGLLVYKENFFIGASVLSVTQPDQGLLGVSKRPLTQIYQGGYNFKLKQKWTCNAYAFLKLQKNWYNGTNSTSFLQYGANVGYSVFKLHLGHRIVEGPLSQGVIVAGGNFTFSGFSFGYNATLFCNNDVRNYFRSMELFVSLNFGSAKKKDTSTGSASGETVTTPATNSPAPIKLFF